MRTKMLTHTVRITPALNLSRNGTSLQGPIRVYTDLLIRLWGSYNGNKNARDLGLRNPADQIMNDEAAVSRQAVTMNILIVDDEPTIRETCAEVAKLSGMKAITVATAEEALEVLENSAVDIVLTDLMLQQSSGLELLKRVHDTSPTLPVIVLTQYGTIDSAVAATRLGAVDYVTKPFRIDELRSG